MLKRLTQFWTDLRPYEKAGTAALTLGILIAISFIGWLFYDGNIVLGGRIDLAKAGQAGSFIAGTSGVCWALAGVFFFISALRIQSEELNAQLTEMSQQKNIFDQQSFEMTFFNILKLNDEKRKNVDFSNDFFLIERHMIENHISSRDKKISEIEETAIRLSTPTIENLKKNEQYRPTTLEISLYNAFVLGLETIYKRGFNKNYYLKILTNSFLWYELRFFLYHAYIIQDEHTLHLINNLDLQIPKENFYRPEHSDFFKIDT